MTRNLKLFEEMQVHLLEDDAPSVYLSRMCETNAFQEYPFSLLCRLKQVPQSPKHHPEGNVWNHTLLVVDEAAKKRAESADPRAFMWAALLHDVGKADTTRNKNGKITSYDHEKVGARQAEEFLKFFIVEEALICRITALIRWHMQILFVVNSMRFADIGSMYREVDIKEIALLGYCDRMGRLNADREGEKENMDRFLKKCREFITKTI
jgi:putative nucleotidyltransferase with HDIG domain